MNETTPKLFNSKNEFLTFLLIYAAHVDYDFSIKEKEYILNFTDKITFEKMFELFDQNNDYSSMKILLQHKNQYFSNTKDENEIFELLKELFKVDGDYSRIEQNFVPFFKRMIDL